jgi:GTA TIM-barrel-like domain/Putative phage tail protein
MATVVLQYAGAAIGTFLGGPVGGILGRAAGAIAGNAIDQQIFGQSRHAQGPRLDDLRIMASEEGAPIPDVYGRMRIAGQVIWATNLEEVTTTSTDKASSKGGPKNTVTEYIYFANFAVGLCEGEVDYVGRCWADGKLVDLQALPHRFYRGSESQEPDSLITAIEGANSAPAFRGLSYIVFERLALTNFGNRIPQLAFEVFRHGNSAASLVRALTIIPGSTEFGYGKTIVTRETSSGVTVSENAHATAARSDWDVSIDEMTGLCRNLDAASLVVSWFGDDLRCGQCQIKPGVEVAAKATSPEQWTVNGLTRNTAHVVSTINGSPAYGGTPSDSSVVAAITDLKARGLNVVFYPFLLMDVPDPNSLPDPYGGAGQGSYPWRGRLTASVAPGLPGTPDKTAAAATQVANFVGTAQPAHFTTSGTTVSYTGPDEWSYRRMILHYAKLCAAAGGVDTFLIGSELRGLTTLRSSASAFPFVAALVQLATDVKSILPSAKISYAADWTEYFGYQPQDGSNDVRFHLDPLWSSASIDFIGIDNYMPMSDWRDGRQHTDYIAGTKSINDLAYLKSNITGGEGFDWYYASQANRDAQTRTPITDGAYNKPWVYRSKDIKSWWLNQHLDRAGGVEAESPTAWVPQSKPVWFTEAGCPAVDKGTNSPNLFFDAKSSESAYPPYSSGLRDDLMQNRYIRALQDYWNASGAHNPLSSVYGGKMLDAARIFYWTWDSRPFPVFPALDTVWSDGPNYEKGHWLTGRLAAVDIGTLIATLAAKFGFADVDVEGVEGLVDGFAIDRPMSARDALEGLLSAFSIDVFEQDGRLTFRSRNRAEEIVIDGSLQVDESADKPLQQITRAQETERPETLNLLYAESAHDYRSAAVAQKRASTQSRREATIVLPAALPQYLAQSRVDIALEESWVARETVSFTLPPDQLKLMPGDVLDSNGSRWRITAIADGMARRIEAVAHAPDIYQASHAPARKALAAAPAIYGPPQLVVMDLAMVTAKSTAAPWFAAFAKPWPGKLALYRKTSAASFTYNRTLDARATMGSTLTALPTGIQWRIDYSNALDIELSYCALASISEEQLLNGENLALIGTPDSGFEIFQFMSAQLIGAKRYRLSGLLRAQAGSFAEMMPRPAGQNFIVLNQAVVQPPLETTQQALPQTWRAGPASQDHASSSYREVSFDPALLPLRPLPPAQLRLQRQTTGYQLTWIRQTRIDGDIWELNDVPLGEDNALYNLDILSGPTVLRSAALATPDYFYTNADILADFGQLPSSLAFRVAQVSATYGAGSFAQGILNV